MIYFYAARRHQPIIPRNRFIPRECANSLPLAVPFWRLMIKFVVKYEQSCK